MYSSSPRQLSYEYDQDNQRYGLYTYALCQSLNSGGAESYMDLWNDLKQFVEARNSMQTPFAEGALRSPIFMRQGAPSSKNSFNVLQKHGNRTLIIDGGSLHGITAGSEVSVIDYTSKSVLSSGRIVQLRAFDTEIELNQAINLPAKESLRVRIDRVNYKEEGCNIQLIIDDRQLGKKSFAISKTMPSLIKSPTKTLIIYSPFIPFIKTVSPTCCKQAKEPVYQLIQ